MADAKHISLSELLGSVGRALEAAFPLPVWVAAEIAGLKVNASSGHCYMELVERGGASGGGSARAEKNHGAVPRASARAVIWRWQWGSLSKYFRGATGRELGVGMKVLVRATVSYHELYGFSLTISDLDASYTLGEAERQRQETIAQLKKDGVWDMNRSVGLPAVVQRVAVVSSPTAAGWGDFSRELDRHPWRFDVTLFEAVVQGAGAEGSIVAALDAIADRMEEFDAVVIIRGGGSSADLSAFDSYRLAAHVAQFPLAVVTGIGHDKDRSVVDMVAALELKTPTAAAVWLADGLAGFWNVLVGLESGISAAAHGFLGREKTLVERFGRVVSLGAADMTRRLELRLERLGGEVVRLSGGLILRRRHTLSALETCVSERPSMFLSRSAERLGGLEQVVASRRPENILALGFAIVRVGAVDGFGGRAVLDAAELTPDQPLDITLARGRVRARAEGRVDGAVGPV